MAARTVRQDLALAAELLGKHAELLTQKAKLDEANKYANAASACRVVTAPGGWAVLKDSDPAPGGMSNLAVLMDENLRAALLEAEQVFGRSLDALAAESLAALLEGRFVPPKAYPGPGPTKKNLNLSIPTVLKEQAAVKAAGLKDETGYRVSLASTITWYLVEELGIDLRATDVLRLVVPTALAEHFTRQAAADGITVERALEEQIQLLVSSSYEPELKARPRDSEGTFQETTGSTMKWGTEIAVSKLTLRLDEALLGELRERTEEITKAAGWPAWPGMVAIAMLRDRLGEPE